MFLATVLVVLQLQLQLSDCGDADRAFGYTNFKIKLKSDHGVIDRKFQNDIEVTEEENTISDVILPKPGGPTIFDPLRQVKVPMVFILNERFENPKFKSRHPRRKKLKNFTLPITNEIETELENEVKKEEKPIKRRPKLKQIKSTGNHANILNTNFRFAYLKRMKQKLEASSRSTTSINKASVLRRRSRKVKRVRKKL